MSDEAKPLQGLNLLLVDDDQDCREFVATVLEDAGAKVTQASDAESGLSLLESQRFDLLTTDKNLPNMDGLGLIRNVRAKHRDLPIILITGFASIGSAVDAIRFGAQDYLTKPLEDPDVLIRAVSRAVEHHRLAQENRALQEALQQAKRKEAIGVLAGGVAHDLNNILEPVVALPGAISDQIEAACTEIRGKIPEAERLPQEMASIKENLRIMAESGRQAAAIVKDLLTLSESGPYEKKTVDAGRMAKDILASPEISEMLRRRPGFTATAEPGPNPGWISGSESHLGRLMASLVRNAIQAMDVRKSRDPAAEMQLSLRTSTVTVDQPVMGYEVIPPGTYVRIDVEDTGTGMEKAVMEKMFDPFFTTKAKGANHGVGLGLTIVHRVLKDHGGFVDVRSAIDMGTTFRIYVPAAAAPAAARPTTGVTDKAHILIVDDEAGARHVAKFLLIKMGYTISQAANGHEALKLFEEAKAKGVEKPFDVMMLDMIMEEGFDGLTTFEHINKIYPKQKVVVSSGYSPKGRAQVILDQGAGWLPKPYGLQELSTAIRRQLESA